MGGAHGVRLLRLRTGGALGVRLLRLRMGGAHGVRLLRLRASRPLRAVLDMRLLRLRAGRALRAVLDVRLLRVRVRRVLLCQTRTGSVRLTLRLCRTAAGRLRRTLRTGRLPFVAEQLIKVLKMIGHGLISLSTWNASLPPCGAGTPFPLRA